MTTHSWRPPPGQESSENHHVRGFGPESELCSTPCPGEQSEDKLESWVKVTYLKIFSWIFSWKQMKTTLISRPKFVRTPKSLTPKDHIPFAFGPGVCKSRVSHTCCSRVMTVCTLKLPLSQGSVIPTDPGRNSPAARICKQRLKHTRSLKNTKDGLHPAQTPKKRAIPVCHV